MLACEPQAFSRKHSPMRPCERPRLQSMMTTTTTLYDLRRVEVPPPLTTAHHFPLLLFAAQACVASGPVSLGWDRVWFMAACVLISHPVCALMCSIRFGTGPRIPPSAASVVRPPRVRPECGWVRVDTSVAVSLCAILYLLHSFGRCLAHELSFILWVNDECSVPPSPLLWTCATPLFVSASFSSASISPPPPLLLHLHIACTRTR